MYRYIAYNWPPVPMTMC